VDPEDVVHVLGRMVGTVRSGGEVLDLQVIRPTPRIEAGGRLLYEYGETPLLAKADAARAAVDSLVAEGKLTEDATDEHDVLTHYPTGGDLVEHGRLPERSSLPAEIVPMLQRLASPCVIRERSLLRRLAVA
jgi:hypothetical protein